MSREEERLKILELIDSGAVSVEQGLQLLNSLGEAEESSGTLPVIQNRSRVSVVARPEPRPVIHTADLSQPESLPSPLPGLNEPVAEDLPEDLSSAESAQDKPEMEKKAATVAKWKSWWWIPMWVGVGVTLVAAFLMYLAWQSNGFGFWFACTWFPFLFGVAVMALAWASRTARWVHVRVTQKPGEKPGKIAISLPIPLHLTAWFLRTFRHHIPGLENTAVDEVIMALKVATPETPFYVEVDEGEDGERVEVYIG